MKRAVERFPVVTFYLLAFIFSWLGWVPQALYHRGLFPFDTPLFNFLGAAGPTLAGVAVIWLRSGRGEVGRLFSGLSRWRAAPAIYLFTFGFWILAGGLTMLLMALLGYQLPALADLPWLALVPIFLIMLLSNVWEEIGWRGFALPRLQARFPDWQVSLLMGLLWSAWHLPLVLNPASPMAGQPWFWEVLFSLSLTVIYTWLFNQTEGSLVLVSIFHAMANTAASLMLEGGILISSYPFIVALTSLAAAIIILRFRGHRRFQSQ